MHPDRMAAGQWLQPNITVKMLRVGMLATFTNSNTTRSLVTEARGSMDVMDSRGKLDVGSRENR